MRPQPRRNDSKCLRPARALRIAALVLAASGSLGVAATYARDAEAQPRQPAPGDVKNATAAFQEGKKLFDAKKFPLAIEQFKKSYQLVASPNSHIYIARCQSEMGQLKEAFATFKDVVAEADMRAKAEPKYAPTRDSAKTELAELANKIGVVTINVRTDNTAAVLKMNGANVPKEQWSKEIPVDPGPIDVILEVPGSEKAEQKVTIVKGQRQTIDIMPPAPQIVQPPPPPPPKKSKPPYLPVGIAFASVGVVGMGMFAVGGALSSGTFGDLKDACGENGPCPDSSHNDLIDKGKTQQLVANIGLGIGAVGLAASVPFFILAATSKPKQSDQQAAGDAPEVGLDLSPGFIGVHGKF